MAFVIIRFLHAQSAPIENYGDDKTLIPLKIIACLLMIQTSIKIQFFTTDTNLLVPSSKNDGIIINIRVMFTSAQKLWSIGSKCVTFTYP